MGIPDFIHRSAKGTWVKSSGQRGRASAPLAKPRDPDSLRAQCAVLQERVSDALAAPGAWQQLAATLAQLGQHHEAVAAFERAQALGASARVQAIPHALSLSALQRHGDAVAILAPMQARQAKDFELANLLGVMYKRVGLLDDALRLLEHAKKLNPHNPSSWQNLGNVHELRSDFAAAADAFAQLARRMPGHAEPWRLHGWALVKQARFTDALSSFAKACALAPDNWRITEALVQVLLKLQRFDEALVVIERLRKRCPVQTEVVVMQARVHLRMGQNQTALSLLEQVLAQHPTHLSANLLLANMHGDGNLRAANEACRRALAGSPESWQAAESLINNLSRSRHDSEAAHMEDAYGAACALLSAHPEQIARTARTLRTVFARMLDLDRFAATGKMAELLPHWQAEARHSLVHYELGQIDHQDDRLRLVQWHREWGRRVEARIKPCILPDMQIAAPALRLKRKLRIGFMSSDLRDHPVGYFASPLLQGYDRDEVEVFCYSFYEGQKSGLQARLEQQGTAFRWWPKRPDHEVAEGIAADGLDMLFELGGSTAMNKLEVMAYRPARIGASWLGYPHSAGLSAIDYILVDPYIRPDDARLLIEQPFEMPETWVTVGPDGFAPVAIAPGLPSDRNAYVTFGTANNPYKFTSACIDAWAAVLRRVPGSHFLFLRPEAAAASFVANARAAFAARDVDPARLDFIGVRGAHLQHYNAIDIALDSLPHGGGTTTCDALWMGVPTVSLVGAGFCERISYSNLSNCGLGDLAVFTKEAYIDTAAMLAEDRARRLQLRHGLRDMIRMNPLGQSARFVHNFYQKVAEVVAS